VRSYVHDTVTLAVHFELKKLRHHISSLSTTNNPQNYLHQLPTSSRKLSKPCVNNPARQVVHSAPSQPFLQSSSKSRPSSPSQPQPHRRCPNPKPGHSPPTATPTAKTKPFTSKATPNTPVPTHRSSSSYSRIGSRLRQTC